jgi:glucose/arabinose dehydrogenase
MRRALALLPVVVLQLLFAPLPVRAALPPDFVLESVTPGTVFDQPTGIAFLPDGGLLVCEKAGRLWQVRNGVRSPVPMWQRESEVLNLDDKGLLDVAVDPHYFQNHFVYLLYTVDPDSDGVDTNSVAFGRLTRYQVGFADSSLLDPATRTILMGATWRDAPPTGSPTHTIGSLRWGADGSLLVTVGEGSWATEADAGGLYPSLFGPDRADPYEDIGAFRAQYVGSLAGKVLRLDPATGHGYPSNPYYDGDVTSKRSRVWAYGLRNPFRFVVKPGTGSADPAAGAPGTLYIGDVGWGSFEELNVARQPGMNFGWPCLEGLAPTIGYPTAQPAHSGCDSTGTYGDPVAPTLPIVTVSHGDPAWGTPSGLAGNCIVAGAFYPGGLYPALYQNRLFFCDFARGWMKVLVADADDHLVQVLDFADQLQGPVDVVSDPLNGNLVYVSIYTGEVRRLRYTGGGGGNHAPVAVAHATPAVGPAPLAVAFSSAGTYDLDGDPLSFSWVFGDGTGSTLPDPAHTYLQPGNYAAILIVDDGRGLEARDTVPVIAGGVSTFPTTPIVDTFDRPNGPVGGNWAGDLSGVTLRDSALAILSEAPTIVEQTVHAGTTQEAYVTLKAITPGALEHNLMLKVQGPAWSDGHIEVAWQAYTGQVVVYTYTPVVGWEQRGGPFPVAFQPGDQFGARAYPNGGVEIYRNGTLVATASVAGWPFAAAGGRIGMSWWIATQSVADDFGGGDAVLPTNTPPHAAILSPVDSTFYDLVDTIVLKGHGSDAEDPPDSLHYRWDVLLHHNNHVHPGLTAFADSSAFLPENHGDGTPVWYETRFIVTDTGGLSDTTSRYIFPEVDLSPTGLGSTPDTIGTSGAAEFHFTLHNAGNMPDPRTHWQLLAQGSGPAVTLAQGDTLAGAGGSVLVSVAVPPLLAAGEYTLRVKVDSANVAVETNEANNASVVRLVVAGSAPDAAPHATILSPADSSFYAAGDTVVLRGHGTDAEDPPDSLHYRWDVLLHDAGQVNLALTAFADSAAFLPGNIGGGTPVWYETRFIVTDTRGLSDTTSRLIFPEVDLSPTGLGSTPDTIGTSGPAEFHFTLHNTGTMPDPRTHWHLVAQGSGPAVSLAEGDTLAGAGGSVLVSVAVPPLLAAGEYALRVRVDSANVAVETNEANDALVVPLTVVDFSAGVGPVPGRLALSSPFPNPTSGRAGLTLDLPARTPVGFEVLDAMGRRVWTDAPRDLEAGRWTLAWSGRDRDGRAVGAGLYLARVTVGGRQFVRRIAVLR